MCVVAVFEFVCQTLCLGSEAKAVYKDMHILKLFVNIGL